MNENEKPQGEGQQDNNKELAKYDKVLSIVARIVGGEQNLSIGKKLGGNATASLVADLFKEENEALEKKVKEGLKDLIKKHVTVTREINDERKKLAKLELDKKKEFTAAANTWLQMIDQSSINTENYVDALKTAFASEAEATDAAPAATAEEKQD